MSIKFFRKDEVVIHNQIYDIWVIINKNVLYLTKFFEARENSMNDVSLLIL